MPEACGDPDTCVLPSAVEHDIWSHALLAFDEKDYEVAAMHFRKLGPRSRPLYNVAMCYMLLDDDDSAMVAFERALRCDPYFCIAHFQLAHIHQIRGRFEKAVSHYAEAVKCTRGNNLIDYAQLGLETTVYACELFLNMASAQMELCNRGAAVSSLVHAHQFRCLLRHDIVDHALVSAAEKWALFSPPEALVFRVKSGRRSLSLGSLRMLSIDSPPLSSRTLLSVAEGEQDKTTKFMAPIHKEAVQDDLEKIQQIHHHRKHSHSSSSHSQSQSHLHLHSYSHSLAASNHSASSDLNCTHLVKIHLIVDEKIKQSRIVSMNRSVDFCSLQTSITRKFGEDLVKLKYRDQDGDMITLCDDLDLQAAYEAAAVSDLASLKLLLWCYPIN